MFPVNLTSFGWSRPRSRRVAKTYLRYVDTLCVSPLYKIMSTLFVLFVSCAYVRRVVSEWVNVGWVSGAMYSTSRASAWCVCTVCLGFERNWRGERMGCTYTAPLRARVPRIQYLDRRIPESKIENELERARSRKQESVWVCGCYLFHPL